MNTLLDNTTSFVSGGSRGIGLAIAKKLLLHGSKVIIVSQNEESLGRGLAELRTVSNDVEGYALNVALFDDVKTLLEKILESSSIDIVVNNAGITKDKFLMRMNKQDWQDIIDINLTSVYNVCRNIIPNMCKMRSGKIINISSVVGIVGNPCQTNYAAAKAGMIGFTKSLAKEVARRGINVNCVAPGFISTDMTSTLDEEKIIAEIPLRKMGSPENIAEAVLFLASPAASYITGQTLVVDGGISL